jgi:cellulose synthase/poly-beta-1,6-N-acetylglucosamine synthase-like glycosyltransferase
LSCGLRGNGMAFSRMLLQTNPPAAFSIVEDLEYGLQLGYSGVRIEYVEEATVRGYMASSAAAAGTQRRRWERGRKALRRPHLRALLRAAWHRRDPRLLDLALDLVVPPLGSLVLATGVGLLVSFAIVPGGVAPWGWGLALAGIVVYVMRGWAFSGVGPAGLVDLAWAPAYIMWKLLLRASDKGRQPREWERTAREARP